MVEVSVQPDDCTIKSLGIVLVKCGISKKAVGKLGATTKNDYQKGLQAWVLSLSTVADVDDEYDEVSFSLKLLPFNTDPAEKPADAFCKFTDTKEHSQAYTLIVHIEPNENMKKEMNGINAPARMRMADNEKAEAKKILQIKRAEDDAESNISGRIDSSLYKSCIPALTYRSLLLESYAKNQMSNNDDGFYCICARDMSGIMFVETNHDDVLFRIVVNHEHELPTMHTVFNLEREISQPNLLMLK
uniref:Uncharacterized protein n=1 Tax=Salix viminalis TaxID=40686 RepID=A0A6N2LDS7_SALVM